MPKTIVVTGGAGFIGSRLVETLVSRGALVRVIDNMSPQVHGPEAVPPPWAAHAQVEFMRASVEDADVLKRAVAGCSAIVHLAAETGTGQSMYQIAHYNRVNSQATALLMEIAQEQEARGLRVVLASSRSVYGEGAFACDCSREPFFPQPRTAAALGMEQWEHICPLCGKAAHAIATSEDAPLRPASVYAATKLAQEDLVRIVADAAGMDYAILRFQNVYGEGQSLNNPYTGILSIFSTRIRRDLDLPIFEDGRESRDFVHVDDVVAAIVAAVDAPGPVARTINVGSGVPTSVEAIARTLSLAMGKPDRTRVTGEYRLGDIRHNFADLSTLKAVLGVTPQISLTEGIGRFAAWTLAQPLPDDQLERANAELRARKLMH